MKSIRKRTRRYRRAAWWLCLFLLCGTWFSAADLCAAAPSEKESIQKPAELYAQSAVLMDADSGRILFAKNGQEERPMASTTKIMTCILALEYGNLDMTVTASVLAASQPEVRLGVRQRMEFRLRDLLYSLMLESHNDAAVIIAEGIGTSLEGFADMMNKKAEELHCAHTYYITPNGLDAEDENGAHHTTAEDLARVMKYCIMDSPQKDMFLEITRTPNYQFTDVSGKSSYYCNNHNAFLHMMEGALSGKTGFTGNAGYCYVGALQSEGRTFIVALLACGWPNNKSYKWKDTRKLMEYAIENFHYQDIDQEMELSALLVAGGVPDGGRLNGPSSVSLKAVPRQEGAGEFPAQPPREGEKLRLLLRDDETVKAEKRIKTVLPAPVAEGTEVGEVSYKLGEEVIYSYRIVTQSDVKKRDFAWCFDKMAEKLLMK